MARAEARGHRRTGWRGVVLCGALLSGPAIHPASASPQGRPTGGQTERGPRLEQRRPPQPERTPHALLFDSGARFQTGSSDQLAFHGPVTVAFWLKVARGREGMLEISLNNFDFWVRASGIEFLVQSAHDLRYSDLGQGAWHHVAGTFDGSRMRLFVDGVEVANGSAWLAGNSVGVKAPIKVHEVVAPAPVVLIDDLRVWRGALSARQVQLVMEHRPVVDVALAAAFDFDDGAGQRVEDRGPEGHHGWLGAEVARPDSVDPIWVTDTPETPADVTQPHTGRPLPDGMQ